jgi:hypothetical protein
MRRRPKNSSPPPDSAASSGYRVGALRISISATSRNPLTGDFGRLVPIDVDLAGSGVEKAVLSFVVLVETIFGLG